MIDCPMPQMACERCGAKVGELCRMKASQHLSDTREATKREAQTRPNPKATP